MNTLGELTLVTTTVALGAAPALAVGPPSGTPIPTNTGTSHMPTNPSSQGTAHQPSNPGNQGSQGQANAPTSPGRQGASHGPSTPGPTASLPAKANAYGKLCQGQSKQHVAGTPGTPFSKCVSDMAKLANNSTNSRIACKDESKKHVAGTPGTPFSQCLADAAKLLKSQAATGNWPLPQAAVKGHRRCRGESKPVDSRGLASGETEPGRAWRAPARRRG